MASPRHQRTTPTTNSTATSPTSSTLPPQLSSLSSPLLKRHRTFNLPKSPHLSYLRTRLSTSVLRPSSQLSPTLSLLNPQSRAFLRPSQAPASHQRTPEWLKKIFANITKSERNGPAFRFFMDLGDAVTYVKHLNIPSGVVGACRLDLAYEHFKEKPHLFHFVPNEKQVKAANKLLKTIPQNGERRKVDGVPVFGAQNLDIAIATTDGIKWYSPYFFDKNMLDNILEESVDQHFHALIQTRHMQRQRDVIDDNLAAEVIEEIGDTMWESPEVQEVLDEIGHPAIPLSVISKAAEIQLLYAIDEVLLGNRWLRKASGIQPKFPYMVDSFEICLINQSCPLVRFLNG
ncbi:hypothetical protein CRYUN_Cryun13aG0081700 [Craigia yunnanensis]